jgi:putative addiction module component (TIGR02574 family)
MRYNSGLSHTLDEIRQIAFELPEVERLELANALQDSVASDSGLDEAWNQEAERRVGDFEAGNAVAFSWGEVETKLRARLAR